MKILFDDNHAPHAFMIMTALPEVSFHTVCWNKHFRPMPSNAVYVQPEYAVQTQWDVVFTDNLSDPFRYPAHRVVFFQHIEHDAGNAGLHARYRAVMDRVDAWLVYSDHKKASLRELGFNPKVSVLRPGFEVWANRGRFDPDLVGCWHNCPNPPMVDHWLKLVEGLKSVMIGHHVTPRIKSLTPPTFESFKSRASSLAVFINPVLGEALGMSPLEAMALGIPVVTGSMPELWEWAFHGWNICVTRNEPSSSRMEMRHYVERLIKNPDVAAAIGRAGQETVLKYYPMDRLRSEFKRLVLCQ